MGAPLEPLLMDHLLQDPSHYRLDLQHLLSMLVVAVAVVLEAEEAVALDTMVVVAAVTTLAQLPRAPQARAALTREA